VKIHWAESKYDVQLAADFKRKYVREVRTAFKEVSKLLPFGSQRINFFIQPRIYGLIEETGDSAHTYNSEFIELAFDPTKDRQGLEVILSGVRPGVFHEMNHAARFNIPIYHKTFLDNCVMEGLATVFTRDYTGEKAGWADYPKNVSDWLYELIDKNDMFYWQEYMFKHADGRRWIGYKVGTYIIDQALERSGKNIIELTKMECKDIMKLAGVNA
jgi:hypothetical protein